MDKKGDAGTGVVLAPLVKIVALIIPFFFLILAYTDSYADEDIVLKEANAIDTGLLVEAVQAVQGNVEFRHKAALDLQFKDGSIVLLSEGIKYDFVKANLFSFQDADIPSGDFILLRNGNEISFHSESQKPVQRKEKLSCRKNEFPDTKTSYAIDPAHGGIETGSKSETGEEGKMTFYLAEAVRKNLPGKSVTLTREAANLFASLDERLFRSESSDALISIHIGEESNKGRLNVYVLGDSRAAQSEILGCILANEFFDSHSISYPIKTEAFGDKEILKGGKTASVYLEIGGIDERIQISRISQSISNGLRRYDEGR